jgi:hypothetical protein
MRTVPVLLVLILSGCTSWMGLEELEALPPGFPLALEGETGRIARHTDGGQISVDVVFEDEAAAKAGHAALLEQAAARGFAESDRGARKKWDYIELKGEGGRLEFGCCPARADTRRLVLVSWWGTDAQGPSTP